MGAHTQLLHAAHMAEHKGCLAIELSMHVSHNHQGLCSAQVVASQQVCYCAVH